MISFTIQMIKLLDLREALQHYGVELRGNAARCPFHDDSTPSFGVYNGTNSQRAHCMGCGWDGDLVQFVRDLYGLNFRDAVAQICTDFHLPAPDGLQLNEREHIRREIYRADARKAEIELAKAIREAYSLMLWLAEEILDSIPPDERRKENDFYADAIFRRMEAESGLDRAEMRLYDLTHEK